MVLFEVRILDLVFEERDILLGWSDEINTFEMHQFLPYIFYLLYEVDIILIQLGLSVHDRDDP